MARLAKTWLVDLAIGCALLVASGAWATSFWDTWTARGGQPSFYQHYFEPAVMIACGRGFVIAEKQPKALEDYLFQRRDAFSCSELPPDLVVGRRYMYQEAWTYLQWTVGLSWRVLGISWSGMGPLFGLLFGTVIALTFAICRLGMGRLLAIGCALGLAASSAHLLNLPHLRDYAKAPFTLALVLIMGRLVLSEVSTRTVLLLAFAYGAVLGIGYGFRTDFLINVPIFALVLFAFLDGGVTRNLMLKAGALLLFLVTLVAASWPAASAVYEKGGCQWHVALLGLQAPFDRHLGVEAAPYDFGYVYQDGYIERVANGYASRMEPGFDGMVFCSHEYDLQTGAYLRDIALLAPGDLATRALGSALQIGELPFRDDAPPITDWASLVYRLRARLLLEVEDSWALYACLLAIVGTAAVNLRVGLFMAAFFLYFAGYPAIQFQNRHYFHLEFIGWFALGLVAHNVWLVARTLRSGLPRWLRARATRAVVFAVASLAVVAGSLAMLRGVQARQVRDLLQAYIDAPKVGLADASLNATGPWPQLLDVRLNEGACGAQPAVTFRYQTDDPAQDYTRTVSIAAHAGGIGETHIFLPVFQNFSGVEISDPSPGCLVGTYRVAQLAGLPVLLGATLPPGWESLPLYQRLIGWDPGTRKTGS